MKYYAVRKGINVGIYETWEECQENTKGFHGAEFKKFKIKEEAEKYLRFEDEMTSSDIVLLSGKGEANAFTDGSYNEKLNYSSYGVVFIGDNNIESLSSGSLEDVYGSRNVTGEIEGIKEAISKAIHFKYSKLKIFYDYEGIEKWAIKDWKAKKPVSRDYVEFIDKNSGKIDLEFQHVKGHSGIDKNELADKLAEYELKSLEPNIENEWGFKSYRYKDQDVIKILNKLQEEIDGFKYYKDEKSNHFVFKCFIDKIEIVIKKYNFESGNLLMIEKGQDDKLFSLVVSYFNDIIRIDSVIPVLNAYHRNQITKNDVYNKLYEIAPVFKDKRVDDYQIFRLLIQSSFNILLDVPDFEDSSFLIIPAARALEGQLKYMFKKEMSIVIKKNSFGFFDKDSVTNTYSLQMKHASKLNQNVVQCINDSYNLFSTVRHVISHFGDIDKGDTVFLSTEDSKEKIAEIIEAISRYY